MNTQTINKKGFTLLELLIVISIIAILSVILIVALNPAETLKKARDTQRIADLASLKTAIAIYVTTKTSPLLDNTTGNTLCVGGSGDNTLWLSYAGAAVGDASLPAGFIDWANPLTFAAGSAVSGSGWIPVPLDTITGGSPISNMPIDPVNTITTTTNITNSDFMYRYSCDVADLTFEVNTKLESAAFVTEDPKATKDGGNNATLYEVGTKLSILPSEASDF